MKQDNLKALRAALNAVLSELRNTTELPQQDQWEFQRAEAGWRGVVVSKPDVGRMILAHPAPGSIFASIKDAIRDEYPEYLQGFGTPFGFGPLREIDLLNQLVSAVYNRFETFAPTEAQIAELIAETGAFLDRKTLRLRFYAPVLNVCGARDLPAVTFPDDITFRPITDDEFSRIYGGITAFATPPTIGTWPEFVFVKELEIPKIFGSTVLSGGVQLQQIIDSLRASLDRCSLVLSIFQDAAGISYDRIYGTAAEFALGVASFAFTSPIAERVAFGLYELSSEEMARLAAHAAMFNYIPPDLEMACHRFVDSSRRLHWQDAILDSVIGLETILLAGIKERGELSYRFALHYSTLYPRDERLAAFKTARDLYDLRSRISHGSPVKAKIRIGAEQVTPTEAALRARTVLRKTIMEFLPRGDDSRRKPAFKDTEYWLSKALGL
jgi:hypothetical protein